ncbi:MAG TPA: ribosome maturation factor RimP, partial [Terriglobales bacterium]
MDLQKIRGIAERVAGSQGLEITEIEFRGLAGKAGRILRIFIERNEAGRKALLQQAQDGNGALPNVNADWLAGVTHEDCAAFSQELSTILDVEDAVDGGTYTLEVSSPGLDRKLLKAADYARFTGSRIKLMTREPVEGNRHFEGRLENFDGRKLLLATIAGKKKKGKLQES